MFRVDAPLTLAPAPDGVWVGTARGLALVSESGTITSFDVGGGAVLSLLTFAESTWIGTAAGLLVLPPGSRSAVVPEGIAGAPGLNAPIVALAARADTLIAATLDQLAWRDPESKRWTLLRPRADLGRLSALAVDPDGVWVGGDYGVALWAVGAGTFKFLRVPLDLPAGVRDLLVAPPYLWVATDSGVVRFMREAVAGR
jgi:ligand-binding sensor domain-containing protein